MDHKNADVAKWIQGATAAELTGILGLAFAQLVAMAGLDVRRAAIPRLVTVAQAAAASGMSVRWFYDHTAEPWMHQMGPRTYRVDLAVLEEWTKQRGA